MKLRSVDTVHTHTHTHTHTQVAIENSLSFSYPKLNKSKDLWLTGLCFFAFKNKEEENERTKEGNKFNSISNYNNSHDNISISSNNFT